MHDIIVTLFFSKQLQCSTHLFDEYDMLLET